MRREDNQATARRTPYNPRTVYVPIEGRDVNGNWTFKTSDGQKYIRDSHGTIRKVTK